MKENTNTKHLTSAKAVWVGVLKFGPIIQIPIKLFAAARDSGVSFSQVHVCAEDKVTKIQQKNYCSTCEANVEHINLSKGFEVGNDAYVVIEASELKALEPKNYENAIGNTIEITSFVDISEVDPIYFEKSYFIGVDQNTKKGGSSNLKPYELFYQTMKGTQKAGISKFIMRGKEYHVVIRAYASGLILHTLYAENEVRNIPEFNVYRGDITILAAEVKLAKQLLENMTGSFDKDTLVDSYAVRVAQLIESKRLNSISANPTGPATTKPEDLTHALTMSLAQASGSSTAGTSSSTSKKKKK